MRITFFLAIFLVLGAESTNSLNGSLLIDGELWTINHGSIFVRAGQLVEVQVLANKPEELSVSSGTLKNLSPGIWRWTAPGEPGEIAKISYSDDDNSYSISAVVLTPFNAGLESRIGSFEVGHYPKSSGIQSDLNYQPPTELLRVTAESQDLFVSPHFQLNQFLCKQAGDWPKYVVPNSALYQALEKILAVVVAHGIEAETLTVMSGYRTPIYNRKIGNVAYSRHIYGDAVDLFIDVDADGTMDDLNGDGESNVQDAEEFANWIEEAVTTPTNASLPGGLGIYAETEARGAFVHFDLRGAEARWQE